LLTVVGRAYGTLSERFEQSFPGIKVQHLAESTVSTWLDQVRRERRDGRYTFDVALMSPDRILGESLWAAVRPLLFRPDVLDPAVWRNGFEARFMDAAGRMCFNWEYQLIHAYAVNTDFVKPDEIRSVKD